jgi:hypothetical protein
MEIKIKTMTTLSKSIQGIINIPNIQGNFRPIGMKFFTFEIQGTEEDPVKVKVPLDLTEWTITMDIKEINNVNRKAFKRLTVGQGLEIMGEDNNVLKFDLDVGFWNTQINDFVYDIVFVSSTGQAFTFLKGSISQLLTATKP